MANILFGLEAGHHNFVATAQAFEPEIRAGAQNQPVLFATGMGYAYAACNLYFRDLERIMNILLMMWMFCSPVFIPVQTFPDKYKWVLDYNPMAMILQIWRDIFYMPDFHPELYLTLLISSIAVFILGRAVFRKMEPGFAEMM